MKSIGPCRKCGEELFWDDDEKRIDNPATMLPGIKIRKLK